MILSSAFRYVLLSVCLGVLPLAAQDLPWLGDYDGVLPDIVHNKLGTLTVADAGDGGYFVYDHNEFGWMWTSQSSYPWFWCSFPVDSPGNGDVLGWVYFDNGSSINDERSFYLNSGQSWITSPRKDTMPKLAKGEYYLVFEQFDSQPISGVCITSNNGANYWGFQKKATNPHKGTPLKTLPLTMYTPGNNAEVKPCFIPWEDLPAYTGDTSQIAKKTGKKPIRKYVIIPNNDLVDSRVYVAESPFSHAGWSSWKTSGTSIPPFAEFIDFLTGDFIVDKVEFTYTGGTLTLNTTTVDFLSIPMTVEGVFKVGSSWGNLRGPVGIIKPTKAIAATFDSATWNPFGGVDWKDSVVKSGSDVYRILSPFRYMDVHNKPAAWQAFFDTYLTYLTTQYRAAGATGIKYPIQVSQQTTDGYYGVITANAAPAKPVWTINTYDKSGTSMVTSFTIDPSTYTGKSYDLFSQANVTNVLVNDIQSAILRGYAHTSDDFKGWANILGTYFPSVEANPSTSNGMWTPSAWTDAASYYSTSNSNVRFSVYSKLIHDSSIIGSASNRTVSPMPTSVNQQQFDYGFPTDNIWSHDATMNGQGGYSTISATIGIHRRQ